MHAALLIGVCAGIAAAADDTYSYGFDVPDSTEGLPCPRSPGELKDSFTADYDKSTRPSIAERLKRLDLNHTFESTKIAPEKVLLQAKLVNLAKVSEPLRRITLELVTVMMWVDPRLQYDSSCGSSASTWNPTAVHYRLRHPPSLSLHTETVQPISISISRLATGVQLRC